MSDYSNCRSTITQLENGTTEVQLDEETLEDINTITRRVFNLFQHPLTDTMLVLFIDSIFAFFMSRDDNIGHLEDLFSYIAEFLGDFEEALERSDNNE